MVSVGIPKITSAAASEDLHRHGDDILAFLKRNYEGRPTTNQGYVA